MQEIIILSKTTVYDKSVAKVNVVDTSGFVFEMQYNADKLGIEKKIDDTDKKIPDSSELVGKTDYNGKVIIEIEARYMLLQIQLLLELLMLLKIR